MRRYKLRHFLALFVLLALPAVTCGVGPVVLDLIERVEVLEAESDSGLIVVDANGTVLGEYVHSNQVLITRIGFPPLLFRISQSTFAAAGSLLYETSDCSGTPWLNESSFPLIYPIVHPEDPDFPIHIPDPSATPASMAIASRFGLFEPGDPLQCWPFLQTRTVVPAIPVFAWGQEFTPPFEVVTRDELSQ